MAIPFFDLSRQNSTHYVEITAAIKQVVDSGRYILGENVSSLEKDFAAYCGTKFAVGVASGTDALHLALRACGVKDGDEVITTPFTFVATAEAIAYCGATPVFVDIEPNTFNIDPLKIEQKITRKTKAILPVHLFGLAAEMEKVMLIAKKYNIKVVEDCAQATGATLKGQKVGSFGDAGAFSFFPTKNLGCFGDGGIITTNNENLANEIKVMRGHGSRVTYYHDIIGYNSRLDELQAAILRVKLPYLGQFIQSRRENAALYDRELKDVLNVSLPANPTHEHTYNQYTLRVKGRDALLSHLQLIGLGAMVYYPVSLHLQSAFASLGHQPGDFPISELVQNEVLSLPIFPELKAEEAFQICLAIKDFARQ